MNLICDCDNTTGSADPRQKHGVSRGAERQDRRHAGASPHDLDQRKVLRRAQPQPRAQREHGGAGPVQHETVSHLNTRAHRSNSGLLHCNVWCFLVLILGSKEKRVACSNTSPEPAGYLRTQSAWCVLI